MKSFLLLPLYFIVFNINAQTFNWANSIKSEGFDECFDLVTDNAGYVYVAGQIEFVADFGHNLFLESAGIHDIFLAKYSPSGELVWAKVAGGVGGDKIQSITLDGMGHIFVAGEFEDSCFWDGIMRYTNGPPGVNNMFIAKYDTSGSAIWVRNIEVAGPLQTRGYGITCDEVGNVYACGGTKGDTYYDNNFLFATAGDYDGTVVKFDPNGNFCWARRLGGVDSDKAYGIVSDRNGSIYVTGYIVGNADFSPTTTVHGRGHTDIFLAKYDTAGTLQWAKMIGDTGFDRGWDITINVNGEIIITGEFQSTNFGASNLHSRGNEDMFLAAYDSNGNNLWAISGGGEEDDIGRAVSHDLEGNLYVIGDYASTGHFPPYTSNSNGFADVFVAKYDSAGRSIDWLKTLGGTNNDRGRGIGTDPDGNVFVCGEYDGNVQFDGLTLAGDTLLDIFVSRIGLGVVCAIEISATTQSTCNGFCNGSALATSNGQAPLTYIWNSNPVQTGPQATGLCGGIYSVTVTDANGCSVSMNATIPESLPIILSTSEANITCNGLCNGTASVSVSGQGPFTYSWSTNPIQLSSSATALCAGVYTVNVTDNNGCITSSSAIIEEPMPLQISSNIQNATCIGCANGNIDLQVSGGTSAYTYNWSNGITTEDLTSIPAGNYSVCINDVNSCSICDSFTISEPTSGINSFEAGSDVSVFPNPMKLFTAIKLNFTVTESTEIMIFNSVGQLIYESEFGGDEFFLTSAGMKSGIYFLRLNNKNNRWEKIISLVIE